MSNILIISFKKRFREKTSSEKLNQPQVCEIYFPSELAVSFFFDDRLPRVRLYYHSQSKLYRIQFNCYFAMGKLFLNADINEVYIDQFQTENGFANPEETVEMSFTCYMYQKRANIMTQ